MEDLFSRKITKIHNGVHLILCFRKTNALISYTAK